MAEKGTDYEYSTIIETWYRNGTRYRRGTTRDGHRFVEKGEDGRYVLDHIQ